VSPRRNPFEEIERFFERMSRQFDEASQRWEADGPFAGWTAEGDSMAVDLVERDDELVAIVDLPGFAQDDVTVEVTDRVLRIEAEREEAVDHEAEDYLRHERRHESTRRSIRLPEEVDTGAVTARMKNGVLTVTLPRLEAEDARRIEIEGE
jgi:HSP20 family protein